MKKFLTPLICALGFSACGSSDPGPDVYYPPDQGQVSEDGVELKASALSGYCYPHIDCPTEGLSCNWNTNPAPFTVYLLHHLEGDVNAGVCRAVDVGSPDAAMPALSAYFGDNTIFGVKTGSQASADLYGDNRYFGDHCRIPTGWGWQHGRVKADIPGHENPDGCGYHAFLYNGISSVSVHF